MSTSNWLLRALDPGLWSEAGAPLKRIDLARGDILQDQDALVEAVYFPDGGVIGLFCGLPSGELIQTAMVGWDGALGVFEACGSRRATYQAEVQVAGAAWRVPVEVYQRAFERSAELRERVHKYVELLLTEARQYVACNALHSVEQRLARSLLEALDRGERNDELPLTQEVLADMLGVQRTTVTEAFGKLARLGIVRARRGVVEVLDRTEMERRACECWRVITAARQEILGSEQPVCDA
jgi:CRP-like cAMP-binding protein